MADPATNVLTGESFGKAESLRDFDLTSLFSIDTDASRMPSLLMPVPSTSI